MLKSPTDIPASSELRAATHEQLEVLAMDLAISRAQLAQRVEELEGQLAFALAPPAEPESDSDVPPDAPPAKTAKSKR